MDLDFLKRLGKALAEQFGENCEVVVHDLKGEDTEHTIVATEKVVEIGECDPDFFDIAGVLVEHVVEGEPKWQI